MEFLSFESNSIAIDILEDILSAIERVEDRTKDIQTIDDFLGSSSQPMGTGSVSHELKPEVRMGHKWEYVLISEDNFYGLSANGATITDICDRCKVSLSAAMGELFV